MQNMMKAFICLVESRATKKGLVVESKFRFTSGVTSGLFIWYLLIGITFDLRIRAEERINA